MPEEKKSFFKLITPAVLGRMGPYRPDAVDELAVDLTTPGAVDPGRQRVLSGPEPEDLLFHPGFARRR